MPTSLTMTTQTLLPNSCPLPPSHTTTWAWTSYVNPPFCKTRNWFPLIGTTLIHEHNALLQHPLIPPQFSSRVIAPLQAGDVDKVKDYVTEILACTGPSWAVKNRRPHSPGSQSPPDDASIQELPRTTLDPLPSWVDDLFARISQLAVLIHEAQDLAPSPSGWIKTSALIAYNGPSIPGNFDTHSGEIVDTSTFLLKVHKLSQPLTDEYIKGLVSKDNLRGPKRFLLQEKRQIPLNLSFASLLSPQRILMLGLLAPHLNRHRVHSPLRKLNHSASTSSSLACSAF